MYKIGTRQSQLAVAYTEKAKNHLSIDLETVFIHSQADLNPDLTIEEMGNKGVFCKEIETALINRDIDLACHAFKDLTRDNDDLLEVTCVLPRSDFRDCLVGNNINPRTIGTSSPRRSYQLTELYPGATIVPIRGNIDSRIAKQENGEYDAIVVAKAGLDTLGLTHKASRIFGTADMLPAPGQGVIALQTRKPETPIDETITAWCWARNDIDTWHMVMAEKYMLKEIDGTCQTPVGCVSIYEEDTIKIIAKNFETNKIAVQSAHYKEYKELGQMLGSQLI